MADEVIGHPGRYCAQAARVLRETKADAVVMVVVNGDKGFGMSFSVDPRKPGAVALASGVGLAEVLRAIANDIDGGAGPDGVRLHEREPHSG